jgi:hypothetical protein
MESLNGGRDETHVALSLIGGEMKRSDPRRRRHCLTVAGAKSGGVELQAAAILRQVANA